MERAYTTYHGRYGLYYVSNNMDLLLAILMLGLSAGFLGSFAEKIGPKKSGLIAMLFWVAGLLGTVLCTLAYIILPYSISSMESSVVSD